jgi:p-methyltransferase
MADSGCAGVFLGVESGDAEMLKKMNKMAKPERYKWGMQGLQERGIATYTSLICGFPGETEETVKNTIAFIEETAPTFYTIQLYYHNRHTPIHTKADEIGLKGGGYNWHHNTMSWREAADWSIYMYKTIQNSIPIPSFEFSMWGIAYLIAQGFTVEQIKSFGRIAQEAFIPSLDDIAIDCSDQERRLVELFKDVSFGDVLEF